MKIEIEYTEKELKELILKDISKKLGTIGFDEKSVKIMVKSKQNYRAEWEEVSFRAILLVIN